MFQRGWSRPALAGMFLCLTTTPVVAQTPTPVPVLTWRYDLTHAGENTQETALTPANVSSGSFGKLFSLSVDDRVFTQPLYVPNLKMSDGNVHNVLFVATENDSVYAFDADTKGTPIWKASLLTVAHGAGSGATPVPQSDVAPSQDIGPNIGITGTPTINTATNTMYVVSNTKESGRYFSRLHAIDITTGAEQPGSPVQITATVSGSGDGSSGGQITFSPLWSNQRPGLDYYNGYVYIAYSSHGDISPFHGWLFAYDAATLKQTAALCLSPTDKGASLWASGAAMPIDTSNGRLYVVTGNGSRNTPLATNSDYGESVIGFNLANGQLSPTDSWTAFNYAKLNSNDWDQGSGGLLMLPDQPGSYTHLLITAGKEGRITVLNRDNLGGLVTGTSSNTNAVQDITLSTVPQGEGFWGTATYWNEHVYVWPGGDITQNNGVPNVGMMFNLNNGVMDTIPDSKTTFTSSFPGPTFSISSNGTQDGIAWAVKSDQFNSGGPAVLYAFDANDLSNILFESDKKSSDTAGPANKFSIPVVTNGKVYVAAKGEVDVYGLVIVEPTAAAPVISPNGGTFSTTQTVTLSTATSSAAIYYTLDGSTPTTASTQYTGPITISSETTVKAIASATGYLQSSVSSATFTFSTQTPDPVISPAGGTYMNAQNVTLTDSDANATIYYTTDGSTPSSSSTPYTGAIQVASSETIKAIAVDPSLTNSNVVTSAYVIQSSATAFNFGDFSSTSGLTLNGTAVAQSSRLYLTTNATWQAGSAFWNAPVNVQQFATTFNFQVVNGQANGFTFTIQNIGPKALGGDSAGLAYQNIQKSVAVKFNFYNYQSEGNDSTGIYTNGQAPVTPSVDISPSGIELASGDMMQAQISYDGTTLSLKLTDLVTNKTFEYSQAIDIPSTVGGNTAYVGFTGGTGGLSSDMEIVNWTYSVESTVSVATPTFSPVAGTYSSSQNVTLSDSTSGATIYYTTDGSTPTTSSTIYSAPISVASSMTIKAFAATNSGSSSVASSSYFIDQNMAAAIDFSNGFSSTAGLQMNGSAVPAGNELELTNGGTWQAGSVFWTTPVNVQAFTTTFQFQLLNAKANGFTFTLQNVGPNALGSNSASLGYHGIAQSVAVKFNFYNYQSEGADSTGVYTDGEHPYPSGVDISPSGIQLASGDTMQAQISYDGTTLTLTLTDLVTNNTFTTSQAIDIPTTVGGNTAYAGFTAGTGGLSADQYLINWTYSTQAAAPQTAPPTFSPGAGTYSTAQNVTLSDSTSGSTIYYTTDGSTPTTSSSVYSAPIAVTSSMTIKAIAQSSLGASAVSSAAYTIQSSTASFTLSGNSFVIGWRGGVIHVPVTVTPSGGFTGSVTLSCSVTGAPAGAVSIPTCTISAQPPAITGSSAVTGKIYVQTVSSTTKGNYTVMVQGTTGSVSDSTSIPFSVN